MSEQFDGIFSELSKAGYFKTIKDINQALSTKVPNSEKGSPYGVAPLDQNRLIPTIHLPSYVDDVLEYSSLNAFPTTGESSKIYVALDKNKIYRWSGSTYIEISPSPGSTDSIPEGTVNLYFTDNRARAAVTTISGNAGTATKLQTARTISLSGDVGGTVTFDGSSSVTMVTTVGDDSHRHSLSTIDGVQPLNSDLTSISSIVGNGVLGRDSLGAWSFSDGVETAFSSVPRIYLGSSLSNGVDCNDLGYGVAVVRIGSNSSYNLNKPQFKVTQASYAYIQTIRGFDAQSGNGKIQIAWPLNVLISTSNPVTGVMAFRSVASNSITFSDWEFIVCNMATTSDYGYMTTAQVAALNTAVSSISTLQTSKENAFTTLPVSKGGTGVSTFTGIPKFTGTSQITAATSTDIVALVPDATTSQSGKMTTAQVSSLNDLSGLVSMGSGIVKKTSSTAGLDIYSTAVINDLVTSTTLVPNLNADLLDGNHASAFALSGHSHGSLDSITGTGVGLLFKTSTSGVGVYSSAQIASLTTTGLTVASITTNGLINISLDAGLDNFAGFSDNSANVGLVKLSAVNSFAKATSSDIVALVPDATASQAGKMTTSQVTALNTAVSAISTLQTAKEDSITTLPVSKGGTGVSTFTGIPKFDGTSAIQAATSNDIVALVPDATTLQAGKMTTSQVSSLNELGGLVSMGSGVVKKTLSTAGLDTYSTAVINDLVTSTTLVPNLNADLLDGKHSSEFSLSGHSHGSLDSITGTGVGLLVKTSTSGAGTYSSAQIASLTTTGLTVASITTNGMINLSLDTGLDNFAGFSDNSTNVGLVKLSAVNSFAKATSNDIVALVPDATTLQAGKMTTSQVTSLNTAVSDISTLQTSKENAFTTLPVSKGGTGVNTLTGIAKFNGTSAIQAATSNDIVALVPDATTLQAGKMTTAQVSSLNDLSGLVSMGSGIVKKTLSTAGLDTYTTAVIADLVTSTSVVTNLNADMLDGNHASSFALSGHSHGSLDAITGTGVGLLYKSSTSGVGTYSSAQIASLTTTGLTVSGITTNGLINLSLDTGLDNFAGFSDNATNVGLVKLSAVNSFAKATTSDIVALVPDATTSQSGKMTTSQVSSLNELGGLVSLGSGVVKKTTSTTGLDTYSTAVIADLVTSTNTVTNLNADMLDGYHVNSARLTASAHIPYVGADGVIELGKYIDFHLTTGADYDLRLTSMLDTNGTNNIANLYLNGGTTANALIWHSGNDGAGSGLDADLFDGIDSTGFLRSNAATMFSGNTLTVATNLKYTPSASLTTQGIVTYGVQDDTNFCRLRTYGRDASNAITGARLGWSTGTRYINIDTSPDPILSAYDCINISPTTTSAQVALRIDGNLVWHEANDGPGSGLNSDLIDNLQGSQLVRNDITNQELKGFSLGAPAGTSLSNGIVFNRGLDNAGGWSLKSSGITASPVFTLVDTFTDAFLRPRYEWSNAAYYPTTTNTISLGSSASKWTVVYATTGTINTSDARMKTQVERFTENELKASKLLADEIGLYKFLDSISTKGDQARRHVGMTVQRSIQIMSQCGLEPFDYGFICYDEWVDDSGETKSQYAFRYDQLNMFIIRGLSERISALEAR